MSYGKYAMKNTGNGNTNLNNNFAQYAYSDPQFALGMLLGQAWSKQYGDRGTKKAIDEAGNDLTLDPNQNDISKATSMLNGLQGTPEPYKMTIPNIPTGQTTFSISGSDTVPNKSNLLATVPGTSINGNGDAQSDKTNLPVPPGSNQKDYYGMDSPTTYSGNGGNADYNMQVNALAQQIAKQRMQNFNKDEYLANKYLALQGKGYSDEQISSIMEPLTMRANAVQTSLNRQRSNDILNKFNTEDGYNLSNGYNQAALSDIIKLMQSDPEAAKMLYANFITAPQEWANDQSYKKMGTQFDYNQKAADNNMKRNMNIADHNNELSKDRASYTAGLGYSYKQKELQDKLNYVAKAYGLNPTDPRVLQFILGSITSTSGTTAGNNNQETANKINAAKQMLVMEQKWGDNWDNNGKEFPYKAQADAARQYLSSVYTNNSVNSNGNNNNELPFVAGNNSAAGQKFEPRFNDYNVAKYDWEQALKRNMSRPANERWSKEQLSQYALQRYGNGDQARKLVNSTDWKSFGY